MTPAPWSDPRIVNAAMDLITDVRDLDPRDIVDQIALIPPPILAELAVTVAAMVDIDQPISALRRWEAGDFLRPRHDDDNEPRVDILIDRRQMRTRQERADTVSRLSAAGLTGVQIAAQMGVSPRTVMRLKAVSS